MIGVGSVVVKIAGRDAGKAGIVIKREGNTVLIDGEVRRREVSLEHVEPLRDVVDVKEGASTAEVRKAMESVGFEFPEERTNKREHKPAPRPRKQRGSASAEKAKPTKGSKKKSARKTEKKPSKSESKKTDSSTKKSTA